MSFFVIVVSYLIGSIPFSHIFPRLIKGRDVREKGTKNVGASNALIVAGKRAGLLALLGDTGKGIVVVLLARYFGLPTSVIAACALAAVIGHDFSLFLGFKGGKGVAVFGGTLIALDPIFTVLVVLLWIFTMLVLRYFIPSTVLVICFVPVMMWMGVLAGRVYSIWHFKRRFGSLCPSGESSAIFRRGRIDDLRNISQTFQKVINQLLTTNNSSACGGLQLTTGYGI